MDTSEMRLRNRELDLQHQAIRMRRLGINVTTPRRSRREVHAHLAPRWEVTAAGRLLYRGSVRHEAEAAHRRSPGSLLVGSEI
jgi:hypothetical protein